MPSHALLICVAALRESKCVGGGIARSGWFVLVLSLAKSHVYTAARRSAFWREKARARLQQMQGKVEFWHVILSSHAIRILLHLLI